MRSRTRRCMCALCVPALQAHTPDAWRCRLVCNQWRARARMRACMRACVHPRSPTPPAWQTIKPCSMHACWAGRTHALPSAFLRPSQPPRPLVRPPTSVHISVTFSRIMLQCRSKALTRPSSLWLLRALMRTCGGRGGSRGWSAPWVTRVWVAECLPMHAAMHAAGGGAQGWRHSSARAHLHACMGV